MTRAPWDWVLVGALSALAGVVGLFGVFFLPAYSGSVPLPLVIIPVAVVVILLPRLTYRLTGRMFAAFLPVLVWFVVTVWLYVSDNSLYRGGSVAWREGWQFMTLLGVCVLGAAASVGTLWGDHLRAQLDARAARSGAGPANVTSDTVQGTSDGGGY